jgi:hypothetical protein
MARWERNMVRRGRVWGEGRRGEMATRSLVMERRKGM